MLLCTMRSSHLLSDHADLVYVEVVCVSESFLRSGSSMTKGGDTLVYHAHFM